MVKKILPALIISLFVLANGSTWAAPEDDGPYSCTKYTQEIPARDNGTITACVYRTDAAGTRPLIIFRHGFSRTKESLDAYGSHWASRGYTVILNDARTGLSPDYAGRDSDDIIDCANWAVQKNNEPDHYLYGTIKPDAVIIGGYSAGGYSALIATHKNHALGDGNFSCAVMMLYDPYPTDADHAAALARDIHMPSIMLHGDRGLCNGFGKGAVIYRNTSGPTYAIHINDASHCDFEPQSSLGCAVLCLGTWDNLRNAAIKRYATAMLEAYVGNDPSAYPYINGSIAQADTSITVYPETHGLDMPPHENDRQHHR